MDSEDPTFKLSEIKALIGTPSHLLDDETMALKSQLISAMHLYDLRQEDWIPVSRDRPEENELVLASDGANRVVCRPSDSVFIDMEWWQPLPDLPVTQDAYQSERSVEDTLAELKARLETSS